LAFRKLNSVKSDFFALPLRLEVIFLFMKVLSRFVLWFPVFFSAAVWAGESLDLPNPGFEEELSSWTVSSQDNGMSQVSPEAARNGAAGLRVDDQNSEFGSSLFSSALPATAGQKYAVRFWARNVSGEGLAVYLIFFDAQNRYLNKQELGNENLLMIPRDSLEWEQFSVEGVAPDGAATVKVWIHSFTKNQVVAEVDDLTVVEVSE
jgi:hypothetical protein